MSKSRITSLWALIEMMQSKLERFGLDEEVVDAAVLLGLEALFGDESRPHAARPRPSLRLAPAGAKA